VPVIGVRVAVTVVMRKHRMCMEMCVRFIDQQPCAAKRQQRGNAK